MKGARELSFSMLGAGVDEHLEGCEIILPSGIGLSDFIANS